MSKAKPKPTHNEPDDEHDDDPIVQRIVPASTAVRSVFELGGGAAKPPPQAAKRRNRLPAFDITNVAINSGVAMPLVAGRAPKGSSRYDTLLDRLTADGMSATAIPTIYRGTLSKAAHTYARTKPHMAKSKLLVRTIDADTIGVWRVKKEAAK